MKKTLFLIMVSLIIAISLTIFLGWLDLKSSLIKEDEKIRELKREGVIFIDSAATGGVPLDFLCRGFCPWRFNIWNFILDTLLWSVLIFAPVQIIVSLFSVFRKR